MENGFSNKFPELLRFALAKKGWKQVDLARDAGISTGLITEWMKGRKTPTAANVYKVARSIGVPASEFFPCLDTQLGDDLATTEEKLKKQVEIHNSAVASINADLKFAKIVEMLAEKTAPAKGEDGMSAAKRLMCDGIYALLGVLEMNELLEVMKFVSDKRREMKSRLQEEINSLSSSAPSAQNNTDQEGIAKP